MKSNRRSVLIGLGALTVGGGAVFGTGAFSSVEADRTATISVADDANAFLGLTPVDAADNPYVEDVGGEVQFNFDGSDSEADGLNDNATTEFANILEVTNEGTNQITLSIEAYDTDVDPENELTGAIGLSIDGDTTVDSGTSKQIGFTFDLVDGDSGQLADVNILRITANE